MKEGEIGRPSSKYGRDEKYKVLVGKPEGNKPLERP
jgi:hypothetical protein